MPGTEESTSRHLSLFNRNRRSPVHELDSDPNMLRLMAEHPLLFREQLPSLF